VWRRLREGMMPVPELMDRFLVDQTGCGLDVSRSVCMRIVHFCVDRCGYGI